MNKPEILIIDDELALRRLLEIALESNDFKVRSAASGREGIVAAANHPPDLILLDLGLPDMSGHDVLKELMIWYHHSIIIISAMNDEENIVKALDNGATDYLTKPFRNAELMARVRASLRRNVKDQPATVITSGDIELDVAKRVVLRNGKAVKLTSTEFQLASLLMVNQGCILTHQQLLKEIWGLNFQNETQYLRVYIGNLRKKLENNPDKPEHFVTESGVGYRFV